MYSHIRARHASLVSKLLLRHTFWLGVNQIHLHVMFSLGAVFQWFGLNKFAEIEYGRYLSVARQDMSCAGRRT